MEDILEYTIASMMPIDIAEDEIKFSLDGSLVSQSGTQWVKGKEGAIAKEVQLKDSRHVSLQTDV